MLLDPPSSQSFVQETLCSLKFATQVNQVELGKAQAKVQHISNSTPSTATKSKSSSVKTAKKQNVKRGVQRPTVSSMRTSKRMKR